MPLAITIKIKELLIRVFLFILRELVDALDGDAPPLE
jgi:hypothetical protein